jgi:hypothetical protein
MRLFSVMIAAMAATIPAVAQADVPHRSREPDAAYRGVRYRLRFMRGMDVIFVDVDARTGRVLWTSAG